MKRRTWYEPLFSTMTTTIPEQHTHEVHSRQNGVTVVTKHWSVHEARLERDWQQKQGVVAEVVTK